MPLLLTSKAACKLAGHTWGCSESRAQGGNPKSRTSQTKSSKTGSNGLGQLRKAG